MLAPLGLGGPWRFSLSDLSAQTLRQFIYYPSGLTTQSLVCTGVSTLQSLLPQAVTPCHFPCVLSCVFSFRDQTRVIDFSVYSAFYLWGKSSDFWNFYMQTPSLPYIFLRQQFILVHILDIDFTFPAFRASTKTTIWWPYKLPDSLSQTLKYHHVWPRDHL